MTLHFSFAGIKPGIFIIVDRLLLLLVKERKHMAAKKPIAVVIGKMSELLIIFDEVL